MKDLLKDLNEQQRKVAQTTHGPVLVLAGAGSGKTRALTYRIAYLLQQKIAVPHEILAVTFTNKAAGEMKDRVSKLVSGISGAPSAISTFHSLGARILREQGRHLPRSQSFMICDTSDSERLIKSAMEELRISSKEYNPKSIRGRVSSAKNVGQSPADVLAEGGRPNDEVASLVYARYEKLLVKNDAYDFDDLLLVPGQLLSQHKELRKHYQNRWRFICVDEYQDTNPPQDMLLKLLTGPEENICVVGDDYQAIYSWRGAKVDHILKFESVYPKCKTIYLTRNYRSTSLILEAANCVIAENTEQKHKELWTAQKGGEAVRVVSVLSGKREAMWVRSQIEEAVSLGGKRRHNGVLYRTNAQSRVLEEEFLTHGIPYTIVGGFRFYERREIKDALAYLQWWVNPNSTLAVRRMSETMWRGVGPKTLAQWEKQVDENGDSLWDIVSKESETKNVLRKVVHAYKMARDKEFDSVSNLLEFLLSNSGYLNYLKKLIDGQERLENIEELFNVATGFTKVEELLEEVTLLTDIDSLAEGQDRVICMTLHSAKGLEFPNVFLVGCEDGLLPHINNVGSAAEMEEERRLMYVGMTRAKKRLYISHAATRYVRGSEVLQMPSRFLSSLPKTVRQQSYSYEEVTDEVDQFDWSAIDSADDEPSVVPWEEGDFVTHDKFGRGVVIGTKGSTLMCVFENHGVRAIQVDDLSAACPS